MKKRAKSIFGWIPEVLSLMSFGVNFLMSLLDRFVKIGKPPTKDNKKPPIIIYEQWITKNYWHILMKKYLERKGFRVYWTNFSLTKGGAEKGASYLDSYIKKHKINNAVLVGISMGAFSAFVYLQRYNGWERVNKFISVAGPFRGSPLAFIPSFFAKTHQIRPNSNYIKKLMSEPIRNPEKIVCIGAQKDEMVPLSSVFLRRARNKLVKVKGHNFLHMFSLAVFRTIAAEAEKEY